MKLPLKWTLIVPALLLTAYLGSVLPHALPEPMRPTLRPAAEQFLKADPNLKVTQGGKIEPKDKAFGHVPPSNELSAKRHAISDAIYGHQQRRFLTMMAKVKFPAAWDARSTWKLPEIDDQGQCGDCYWWSAVRAIITANIVAGTVNVDKIGTSIKGTVQYGLDYYPNQGGCNGGDEYSCSALAISKGFPTPDNYSGSGQSPGSKKPITGTLVSVKNIMFCTPGAGPNSRLVVEDVKATLMKYGPVSFAAAASSWGQGTGVITSNDNSVNHAITIYGWDDSKGPKGAWLVMNQWSKQWGNDGFLWLGYGACGACEGYVCVVDSVIPVTTVVPNVVGDTLGDATAVLKTAGLTLGTLTGDQAQKVTSQSPVAGTSVPTGSAVSLTFGTKPPIPPVGGTPPYTLWEGIAPKYTPVGNPAGYPDLASAETAGQAIANADKSPVAIYDSAKVPQLMETLMPKSPGPGGPIASITVTFSDGSTSQFMAISADTKLGDLLEQMMRQQQAKKLKE